MVVRADGQSPTLVFSKLPPEYKDAGSDMHHGAPTDCSTLFVFEVYQRDFPLEDPVDAVVMYEIITQDGQTLIVPEMQGEPIEISRPNYLLLLAKVEIGPTLIRQ